MINLQRIIVTNSDNVAADESNTHSTEDELVEHLQPWKMGKTQPRTSRMGGRSDHDALSVQ